MGCKLTVEKKDKEYYVTGNSCPRGEVYGKQEMLAPQRTITSTVKVKNGFLNLCPVKTESNILKEKIFEVMEEINKVEMEAPVKLGQVIIKNVSNTGVDVIATRDIEER